MPVTAAAAEATVTHVGLALPMTTTGKSYALASSVRSHRCYNQIRKLGNMPFYTGGYASVCAVVRVGHLGYSESDSYS